MGKAGRPKKEKYETDKMISAIDNYMENKKEDIPILKECCLENDWNYDYVMQLQRSSDELSQSIKKLLMLKEVNLEKGGLIGKYDKTMAVFSLKQLGWKDKIEEDTGKEVMSKLDELLEQTKNQSGGAND